MRFEKWQALGNDYAIAQESALPFALTAQRVRALCAPHTGVGSDGLLVLGEPAGEGACASLRIFNPDGSEAELSGNGVREAALYLHRHGHADGDTVSIETAAGRVGARISGPSTCTVHMGRAQLSSPDFPGGDEDGRGTLTAAGHELSFQHVSIGNPQCAIEWPDGLDELDLAEPGAAIERHDLFPNRTNVSFWRREGDRAIRARIFERGVGETMSSGTGATGAAVAAVLRGVGAPVTVRLDGGELEVDVDDELRIHLTGWAVPVFAGELSPDFLEALERE